MQYHPIYGAMPPFELKPTIVKNYQIVENGPLGSHTKINAIYEDVLPETNISTSFNSVSNRSLIHKYIRASIFRNDDGGNTSFDNSTNNSIISYLKFGELNPFRPADHITENPYECMPDYYLIYRSCYPIRHNPSTLSTKCAKNSTSVIIKIYGITNESHQNYLSATNKLNYDEWRDVKFYEIIKTNILNKRTSPHFLYMYGYFIATESGINFKKINDDKNKDYKDGKTKPDTRIENLKYTKDQLQEMARKTKEELKKTLAAAPIGVSDDRKKALVILTESPSFNLISWGSPQYTKKGNVYEMVHRGIHPDEEWKVILFQLLVGIYVMINEGIYIKDFDLKTNVYIRDVSADAGTKYWLYKINGVNYYIPNLGSLVIIDTDYKSYDVKDTEHKLHFKDEGKPEEEYTKLFDDIIEKVKEINSDKDHDYIKPSLEIFNKLDSVKTDHNRDISKWLEHNMSCFMNNRIGDYLKKDEINSVKDITGNEKFNHGDIVVYQEGSDEMKFGLCLEDGERKILKNQKDGEIIDTKGINIHQYSKADPIVQNIKQDGINFTEENMIELYTINYNRKEPEPIF